MDRVLVYVTLYIIECLKRMQKQPNLERATLDMHAAAREQFSLPGEANFPLNAFFSKEMFSRVNKRYGFFVDQNRSILNIWKMSVDPVEMECR